jgi:hypothetical protein
MSIPSLEMTIRFATMACGVSVGVSVGVSATFDRVAEGVAREDGEMECPVGVAIDGEAAADAVYSQLSWVPSSKAATATTPIAARMYLG